MGCRCRASACRARRDQAAFVGVNDFWTRSQSELLQDLGHLDLGRRSTNYKLAADLQVGQPSDEQVEHKALFMSGYPRPVFVFKAGRSQRSPSGENHSRKRATRAIRTGTQRLFPWLQED